MDAFTGEIRLFPYIFVPEGWLACDGSLQSIQQYPALYSIVGVKFGGDGQSTFGLPDLRARVAVGAGDDPTDTFDPPYGQAGGAEGIGLNSAQVPPHSHTVYMAAVGKNRVSSALGNYIGPPAGIVGGKAITARSFTTALQTPVALNPGTLAPFPGGTDLHENRQPYQALQYCICCLGDYYPVRP